ncbi:MAG: deoxyribose-phosphate aldolase [Legionella sp.]|nr:deoxyribose-phosphate aldolase [Legionella sp.]
MTLESHFNEVLEQLLRSTSVTAEQLIHCIDLTLLDEHASTEALAQLNQDARINNVAAVCVYSKHLAQFQQLNQIQLATVINFPQAEDALSDSLLAIKQAIALGVTEIDYVFPYPMYFSGKKQEALTQCKAIIEVCKNHKLTSKIILETGAFSEIRDIYEVSAQLIQMGGDFLKTSTGKIAQGASLSAVFALLSAIKDNGNGAGFKVSGGVKTPAQAAQYAQLAELISGKQINSSWFRIGASSLLGELLKSN